MLVLYKLPFTWPHFSMLAILNKKKGILGHTNKQENTRFIFSLLRVTGFPKMQRVYIDVRSTHKLYNDWKGASKASGLTVQYLMIKHAHEMTMLTRRMCSRAARRLHPKYHSGTKWATFAIDDWKQFRLLRLNYSTYEKKKKTRIVTM